MESTEYTRFLGSRLLAEANDLKRTPSILAKELNVRLDTISNGIKGELSLQEYKALFDLIERRYASSIAGAMLGEIGLNSGVIYMSGEDSFESRRTIHRPDRNGNLQPYYEYRDTATARLSPIRPEWIQVLRFVSDSDPLNRDVAYNTGHFLHQTTLFLGPTNFYWEIDGMRYSTTLREEDSNYIAPFCPHTFASPASAEPSKIIAVTYGAAIARARAEFAVIGKDATLDLTVDFSGAKGYAALLRRQLSHEGFADSTFIRLCNLHGLDQNRIEDVLTARIVPTDQEILAMAGILSIPARDLIPPIQSQESVIIHRRESGTSHLYPNIAEPAYEITPLVRVPQQPELKPLLLKVMPGIHKDAFRVSLHQYIYNYGLTEIIFIADYKGREAKYTIKPGDSVYIAPMTGCCFANEADVIGKLYLVRVPSNLDIYAITELSNLPTSCLSRVSNETTSWF